MLVRVLTLVALALAFAGAPGRAWADARPLVVSVGVNSSFDSRLDPLQWAEVDAERFAAVMGAVGGVDRRDITLLRSPTADEFVASVRRLLDTRQKNETEGESTRLVLYFSGHADDRGLHFRGGPLARERLHEMLAKAKVATKIIFIDSCFSGAIATKGVVESDAFAVPKLDMDELTGSVFLTASSKREVAYESTELTGSVFTHYVLSGLNGSADANADGLVTVDELYGYVYRETKLRSLAYPGAESQRPEFHAELHGQGAIVLAKPLNSAGNLKVIPGVIGRVHLASASGLGSYSVYGDLEKTIDFKIPAGAYNALIRRGEMVGEATILITPAETTELRAGQFTWRNLEMMTKLASSKGLPGVTSTTIATLGMQRATGATQLDTASFEISRELFSVAAPHSRISLYGQADVYAGSGVIRHENLSRYGSTLSLALMYVRPNFVMRPIMGAGAAREKQEWEHQLRDMAGAAYETEYVNNYTTNYSFYAGLMLPALTTDSGRWSLAGRQQVLWISDVFGDTQVVKQFLVGVAFEER